MCNVTKHRSNCSHCCGGNITRLTDRNSAFYCMRQNVSITVIVIVIKRVQQLHARWTNSSRRTLRHHRLTPVSSQAVSTRHNRLYNRLSCKRGFTELRRRLICAVFARFICLVEHERATRSKDLQSVRGNAITGPVYTCRNMRQPASVSSNST